jgi:hypothetical protein
MFLGHKDPEPLVRGMDPDPSISVVDPYSFFTDPDPEFAVGDQYGSGSRIRIRIHNTAIYH